MFRTVFCGGCLVHGRSVLNHVWDSGLQLRFWEFCRWGNASSPAYGTLSDYQFMRRHSTNPKRQEKARQQWGESLATVDDIINVFVKYTSGMHPMSSTTMRNA